MSALQQRVMRRVYAIWALRQVTSIRALKMYILFGAMLQVISSVSIASVFRNASHTTDIFSRINFFTSAFISTEFVIQASLLLGTICAVWFLRDIFSSTRNVSFATSSAGR